VGTVRVRHKVNNTAIQLMLRNPNGGVAKDMLKRAVKVQTAAKKNLSRPPQRVRTGYLRASIYIKPVIIDGMPGFRIGTSVRYAWFVHNGTGIYGPRHTVIRPKRAQYLVFKPSGLNHVIFAKQVKGMRPNPFLKDALKAARS